jgi:hypothetical protein
LGNIYDLYRLVLSMEACNLDIPISTHLHQILAVILLLGSLVHVANSIDKACGDKLPVCC